MSIHGFYKALEKEADVSQFEVLLEQKAVQDQLSARNNKALFLAIKLGNLNFVEALLKFPAVRQKIACNNNQLFIAAIMGATKEYSIDRKAIVLKLYHYQAVKDNLAAGKNSALRWTARNGDLDFVNELLACESVRRDVGVRNFEAVIWALEAEHFHIVERFLEFPQVQVALRGGHPTLLTDIFKSGCLALCQKVMQLDGLPDCLDGMGLTILKPAIKSGNLDVVNLLLPLPGMQAFLNEDEDFALDVIGAACKVGSLSILQKLLEMQRMRDLMTESVALVWAADKGHLDIVNALLPFQWDEEALWDAAEAACEGGHLDILKKLFENDEVVRMIAGNNNGLLKIACSQRNLDIVQCLLEFPQVQLELGNSGWDMLRCACNHDAIDIFKELLKHPEARSHAADMSNCLLRIAVKQRYDEITDMLLECAAVRQHISVSMMPMNINFVHIALNQRRKAKGDDIAARLVRAGFPIELLSTEERRVAESILVTPHTALAINRRKPNEVQAKPFNLTQKDLKNKKGQISFAAGILAHPRCGVDVAQKIASFLPLMSMQKARKFITYIDNSAPKERPKETKIRKK